MRIHKRAVLVGLASCSTVFAQSPLVPSRFARLESTAALPATNLDDAASGDIDGDGDIDILGARRVHPLSVLINDGSGRFVNEAATRVVGAPGGFLPSHYYVDLADVELERPHPLSRMPAGLLDVLTASEIQDLFAYTLSGGDPEAAAFED